MSDDEERAVTLDWHNSMTALLVMGSIRWLGLFPLLDWNAKEIMDANKAEKEPESET